MAMKECRMAKKQNQKKKPQRNQATREHCSSHQLKKSTPDTLLKKKLDGVPATLFGFLNIVSSRIGEENLLKSPIVIFDDGRVFIMKNYVDYRNDSRMEQDIDIPRDWYSSAWVSFWEPMDAKSIRTPDGEFAVDVMERYLKKLEVTGYDKIRANTVNNRGSRTTCTVMKQIMKLSKVQEPFTRCEQLKNAYDIEDGYYLDFDNGAPIIRCVMNGKEAGMIRTDKEVYRKYYGNTWVSTDKDRIVNEDLECKILNKEEFEKSNLKYAQISWDKNIMHIIEELCANTDSPYEQLMKTAYAPKITAYIEKRKAENTDKELTDILKELFALEEFDVNGKNLYQKVNLTKHQFKFLMEQGIDAPDVDAVMDYVRRTADRYNVNLASITEKEFDNLFWYYARARQESTRARYYVYRAHYLLGYRELDQYLDNWKQFSVVANMYAELYDTLKKKYGTDTILIDNKNLPDLIYTNCEALYKDFLSMRNTLIQSHFIRKTDAPLDLFTKTRDEKEIQVMHDKLAKWETIRKEVMYSDSSEAWKHQYEEWKKLEYMPKNGDYCIVAPKRANDLVKEGKKLHHCVASYVERVSENKTNIYFIRNKDAKDEPFYTVEVQKGIIKQVHGLNNCNPTPNVLMFVSKWAKVKDLMLGDYTQLRG